MSPNRTIGINIFEFRQITKLYISMIRTIVLVIILSVSLSMNLYSKEKKTVKALPEHATVFFKGAEVTHSVATTLARGDNEIWVRGLSPNIDQNSIRISTTGGVLVSSFTFTVDYLSKQSAPAANVKQWQDSLAVCNEGLKVINDNLQTVNEVIQLLNKNKDISRNEKAVVADIIQLTDYYKTKMTELLKEKRDNEKKKTTLSETIWRLQAQIDQETGKNLKSENVLKLQLMSPAAINSTVKIIYYTDNASWTPYYDINVSGTDKPIKIVSKAKVRQTTGNDWSKVKLTLSTSAPSAGKSAPLFSTWFLDYLQAAPPIGITSMLQGRVAGVTAQNSLSYEMADAKDMKIRGKNAPSPSADPLVIVNGVPMEGQKLSDIDASMIKNVEVLKGGASTASLYGSAAANGVVLVTLKSDMDDFVIRDENQLNMSYNIDLPYSLEGNGKDESINLQTYDVSAEFKYYCAPKLDPETYVVAEISDWEKLGLLSGKANITFDGTYVGEASINASSTHEKLALTLGTDKRVTVKRERLSQFSSKKTFGSDIKQEFVYKLTVRNNQNKAVKMVLKDQYPISTQKDINVEQLKETTIPTFNNEEVGVLSWEFELNPGESKEFKNAYSVKYPKNKPINL